MITQELSTLLENVDKTVFKAIDLLATSSGYSVDRSVAGIRNSESQWKAAEALIIADKGFVVGVRSSANAHDLGNKKVPRIVYKPQRLQVGTIGNPAGYENIPDGAGGFNKEKSARQTSDYFFEIGIHAQNSSELRVLQSIVKTAIDHSDYLTLEGSNPAEYFMVTQTGYLDQWDKAKGTMDTYFQYQAHDFLASSPKIDTSNIIVPITEVDLSQS